MKNKADKKVSRKTSYGYFILSYHTKDAKIAKLTVFFKMNISNSKDLPRAAKAAGILEELSSLNFPLIAMAGDC